MGFNNKKAFPGQPSVLIEGLDCVFFRTPSYSKMAYPATAKEKVVL